MRTLPSNITCAWLIASGCGTAAWAQSTVPDYDFSFARITHAGNAPYMGGSDGAVPVTGRGTVNYEYRMSKLEVTTGQWIEFANTFLGTATPPPLFNFTPVFWGGRFDPSYSGPGERYIANPSVPNAAMLPVSGISHNMAMLYCNWLHNGKSSDPRSLVTGAYDTRLIPTTINAPQYLYPPRLPGATFWIPSLDEWIKAAHFDPNRNGPGQAGWWTYRNMRETQGIPGLPGVGTTSAGAEAPGITLPDLWQIPLGAYTDQVSPWGLWDTSGGAFEWTDEIGSQLNPETEERLSFGPSAGFPAPQFWERISFAISEDLPTGNALTGLRIASAVPSPSTVAPICLGLLIIARRSRRHSACGQPVQEVFR